MAHLLGQAGYEMTEREEDATLVVIESCAIRGQAENKVYSVLGRLKPEKEARGLTVAVCGCLATAENAPRLVSRYGADIVLGPRRVARLAEALAERDGRVVIDVGDAWAVPPAGILCPDIPGVSAFLTVMQGCSNACSYCVVPSRRGAAESRPPSDILRDLQHLEACGCREVTLIGQNISYYGIDRPEYGRLIDLLKQVESGCAIPRIRFATSHPAFIDARFIEGFAGLSRIMPFLHLPVQSGSDAVLKRMRRGYTAGRYREIVETVRGLRPGTALFTDFLAGFDGETEADHRETLALVDEIGFDGVYAFHYSERPGTPVMAARREGVVPEAERKRRCTEILERAERAALARRARQVGETVEVLVEAPGRGRTPQNILVRFDGGRSGETIRVRITGAAPFALDGERLT